MILFNAWGYGVSILELAAASTSLLAVYLGTTKKRIMWPWWILSSTLYAIWFFDAKYYASVATQFIFIAFGAWGWFSWKSGGALPATLTIKGRVVALGTFTLSWLAFAPTLQSLGAVSIWSDTFGLLGSLVAQVIMVREKWENWVLWFIVDLVLAVQYIRGGFYFTGLLYALFTAIALLGWLRWYRDARSANR